MIIGRKSECEDLKRALKHPESQLIAVYGRRRVGKTFLIREFFDNRFTFYHTGMHGCGIKEQLLAFRDSLIQYGALKQEAIGNWREAFLCLRRLLEARKSYSLMNFRGWIPHAPIFFLLSSISGTVGRPLGRISS